MKLVNLTKQTSKFMRHAKLNGLNGVEDYVYRHVLSEAQHGLCYFDSYWGCKCHRDMIYKVAKKLGFAVLKDPCPHNSEASYGVRICW